MLVSASLGPCPVLNAISNAVYYVVQNWSDYQPHAVCLLEEPAIIAAYVISNLGVALAYYMIPLLMWRLAGRYPVIPFRSVIAMFVVFILACGTTHVTKVLTLFIGGWTYWLDVVVCGVTMVASLGTAIGLLRHGPRIAALTGRLLARPDAI